MTDPVPPQPPSLPPPPPPPAPPPPLPPVLPPVLPPAPGAAAPVPVIRWGMGDVFYGLLLWLVGGVLSAVVMLATGSIDTSDGSVEELGLGMVAVTLASGWIGFVGWPVVASHRKGQRSLAADFGLSLRAVDLGWGVLGGVAALGLSIVGNLVWLVLSGDDPPDNAGFLPDDPGLLTALGLFVLVAICTPVAEELFFRGLMLRAIGRRWGLPMGVVASSLVFGLFHFEGSSVGRALFIVAVTGAYGAVFALLVVRAHGRLGPAIVAHAVVNGVGVLLTVLA